MRLSHSSACGGDGTSDEWRATYQLPEGDLGTACVVDEPPGVASDRSNADIDADDHIPGEQPGSNEALTTVPRRNTHDAVVRGIEAESGRGKTVSDEVDPEQLDGDERFGHAQKHGQEYADDLANVRGDCAPLAEFAHDHIICTH